MRLMSSSAKVCRGSSEEEEEVICVTRAKRVLKVSSREENTIATERVHGE